jgi:MraZ protein
MFIGEYTHSIDDKKRLSVPSRFRKELGKKAVVTHGLDKCLAIYPMDEWKEFANSLAHLSKGKAEDRQFSRFILSGATEVDVDSVGRILIPEHLKLSAHLSEKVVLAGVYDHIELWDGDAWVMQKAQMASDASRIAERLGESGVF